jgi:predicted P-loop ATPase
MNFWVTIWDDLYGRTGHGETFSLEDLAEFIKSERAPTKDQLRLITSGRFGSLKSPPGPNGKGGASLRWEGNLHSSTGLDLDHDLGTMPFQEMVDRLNTRGLAFLAYTTASHTPAAPRWRVHCPFGQELPPSQRGRMADRINGLLGNALAAESWTPSQAWRCGVVDGVPFEIAVGDGDEPVDECEELDAIRRGKPGGKTTGTTKTGKPDLKSLDENELEEEIRNNRSPFHASGRLLWLWALQEIPKADAQANLEAIFDSIPQADRGPKWPTHRRAIPQWVDKIYARAAKHLGTFLAKLVTFFTEDPLFRGAIRLNGFSQMLEVSNPFPPQPGQNLEICRPLREVDVLEALLIVQAKGFPKASHVDVWRAIILAAERQTYHPVRDYLNALTWDGTPRVHQLFFDYFPSALPSGKDDRTPPSAKEPSWRDKWAAYYEATAKCFMIGAVARVMAPGCKVDSLPIFVSEQRYYKGLALQALVGNPAWFSDDIPVDVVDKDAKDALVGKWIVELSETPHLKRDVERFKAFVSRQTDRFRRAYERLTQDWPRQTALTGTSNDLTYLDVTGNRRFWAIPLAAPANVALIKADRDQLWAEAVHLYNDKTPWWLNEELEDIAAEIQTGYVEDDLLDIPVGKWIAQRRDQKTKKIEPFEMSELYPALTTQLGLGSSLGVPFAGPTLPSKSDQMRIANCLKRLGFRRRLERVSGAPRRVWVERI